MTRLPPRSNLPYTLCPYTPLVRSLILLPSNRARSAVQAAFVRAGGMGLLMPRLAVIGDADLDESVALALDPIDESEAIPPAIDALKRRLMLAALIEKHNRSEEHKSELQSLMRISYAVFCLKK